MNKSFFASVRHIKLKNSSNFTHRLELTKLWVTQICDEGTEGIQTSEIIVNYKRRKSRLGKFLGPITL